MKKIVILDLSKDIDLKIENSLIFDEDYAIQLNRTNSYDLNNSALTYSWQKPDNFLMILSDTPSPIIRFGWDAYS